jgi:hypothetical protein
MTFRLVDPSASYYVQLENVTNMDNQDLKTMVDRQEMGSDHGECLKIKDLC